MARRGLVALPPKGSISLIHVEDLCRLILDVIDEPDTHAELYEPDDGAELGWPHKSFAKHLGQAVGRNAATIAMPRALLHGLARIDGLVRRQSAKLTADRVNYICHPDWVATAGRRPPPALWRPQIPTEQGLADTAEWYRTEGWLK